MFVYEDGENEKDRIVKKRHTSEREKNKKRHEREGEEKKEKVCMRHRKRTKVTENEIKWGKFKD